MAFSCRCVSSSWGTRLSSAAIFMSSGRVRASPRDVLERSYFVTNSSQRSKPPAMTSMEHLPGLIICRRRLRTLPPVSGSKRLLNFRQASIPLDPELQTMSLASPSVIWTNMLYTWWDFSKMSSILLAGSASSPKACSSVSFVIVSLVSVAHSMTSSRDGCTLTMKFKVVLCHTPNFFSSSFSSPPPNIVGLPMPLVSTKDADPLLAAILSIDVARRSMTCVLTCSVESC